MVTGYSRNEYQKGQVLLIIVLVMIVALSIGLSVVTRSITNLQISSEEESSQRALSAAEAGIERALQSQEGVTGAIPLENNSQIDNVTVDTLSGNEFLVNNGNLVLKDDGVDIGLSRYDEDNPAVRYSDPYTNFISVYWGSPNNSCDDANNQPAALELLLVTKAEGEPAQIRHYALDACANRTVANNFCGETPAATEKCPKVDIYDATSAPDVNGQQFSYRAQFGVADGVMIRAVPLYASTTIGVITPQDAPLPSQGSVIESLGTSGSTQRKLSVYKGFSKIPTEFFPYVLFWPNPQ